MKRFIALMLLLLSAGSCEKEEVNRTNCVDCVISQNGQTTNSESLCGTDAEIVEFKINFYMHYLYYSGDKQCKER